MEEEDCYKAIFHLDLVRYVDWEGTNVGIYSCVLTKKFLV